MTVSTPVGVLRVSVRELEETTWRALLAAGASPGEAAYAARSVRFAEMHLGAGLPAVPPQLGRVPASRTPCGLLRGIVDVVADPADRGLLLLAPLAIGLVATRPASSPVLVPGLAWDAVVSGMLASHNHTAEPTLMAFEIDDTGEPGHGAIAHPDGGLSLLDGEPLAAWLHHQPRLRAAAVDASPAGGLMFSSDLTRLGVPTGIPVTHPATSLCRRQAELQGIEVEASTWDPVYRAARRYLVAER